MSAGEPTQAATTLKLSGVVQLPLRAHARRRNARNRPPQPRHAARYGRPDHGQRSRRDRSRDRATTRRTRTTTRHPTPPRLRHVVAEKLSAKTRTSEARGTRGSIVGLAHSAGPFPAGMSRCCPVSHASYFPQTTTLTRLAWSTVLAREDLFCTDCGPERTRRPTACVDTAHH